MIQLQRMQPSENRKDKHSVGTLIAQISDTSFTSYNRELFNNLSFIVRYGEITAVTGKSGSGKTVLLKVLAGKESSNSGYVQVLTSNIGYLPQEIDDLKVSEYIPLVTLFKESVGLKTLEEEISSYEKMIDQDPAKYDEVANLYGEVLEKYQELGGYQAESDILRIMAGLRVDEANIGNIGLNTTLSQVSSGQKRKILLGLALYSSPQLLLLDDPTVHLDLESVNWLVQYLRKIKSAVIIATNNSTFIDQIANQTIGLTDSGRTFLFSGGYSEFTKKRDALIAAEKMEADSVKNKIEKLKETDQLFRSKNVYKRSADMAQVGRALNTRINRLESQHDNMPGSQDIYENESVKKLVFQSEHRSGQDVISIRGITKSYAEEFEVVKLAGRNFTIRRCEKWLIWGPNGSGKSTLVRAIVDSASNGPFLPDTGYVKVGEGVKISYGAPDISYIPKNGNILQTMHGLFGNRTVGRVSTVLRFFGFTNTQMYKQDIKTLGFGEKRRLNLAYQMLSDPNLLILDEPTGDYLSDDIKDRLASAIAGYDDTLIIISHDKEFIDKLHIDHILEMPSGKIQDLR